MINRTSLLAVALPVLVASAPARADAVAPADIVAIRGVIEAQLAAFNADDAARAFAQAAPSIQAQFGSPERFIAMVRVAYPPVYRASNVTFLVPQSDAGDIVQSVHLMDADGAPWVAIYRLERQADGTWRISGCALARSNGVTT